MQVNTATNQALYNQNITNNQNQQQDKLQESDNRFKPNKYYVKSVYFFELSEDISKYQISDKEKKERYQIGQDVWSTVLNALKNKKFMFDNAHPLLPAINEKISAYDPVKNKADMEYFEKAIKDGIISEPDYGDLAKYLKENTAILIREPVTSISEAMSKTISGYNTVIDTSYMTKDEAKKTLEIFKLISPSAMTEKEFNLIAEIKNREEEEKKTKRVEQEKLMEPKTYEEYIKQEIEIDKRLRKEGKLFSPPTIFDDLKRLTDQRDLFQARYYLTDEFRKTDKFEELFKEYMEKIKKRNASIRAEVPYLSFADQQNYVMNKLSNIAPNSSSIVTNEGKKDWINHFSGYIDKLKIVLENAKNSLQGENSRYAHKAIPEIEKNIEFFDTIVKNLKEKWKHGNFDMVA